MRTLLRLLFTKIFDPTSGLLDVADERERQLFEENFTDEHDDRLIDGSLAMVGACYAATDWLYVATPDGAFRAAWPCTWLQRWDKRAERPRSYGTNRSSPTPETLYGIEFRIKELAKAGALIVAEIDRLKRHEVRVRAEEDRTVRQRAGRGIACAEPAAAAVAHG